MGATKSAASFTSKGDGDCCCDNRDGNGDGRGDGGWDWVSWTWDNGCVDSNNGGCGGFGGVWGDCNEFLWFTVNEREKWKE